MIRLGHIKKPLDLREWHDRCDRAGVDGSDVWRKRPLINRQLRIRELIALGFTEAAKELSKDRTYPR